MASKVRVHAKSLKWAALGIVDAYVKMYPQSTVADLNKAFPAATLVNGDKLIYTMAELQKEVASTESSRDDEALADWKKNNYFVTLSNGTKVSFSTHLIWTKDSFPKLESQAKLYDVEIASFEKWEAGKKGSYSLEYLNGYVPPKAKSNKWLLPLLIGLAALAILLFFVGKSCSDEKVVVQEKVVEKVIVDTVTIVKVEKELEAIEKNFNAAQFEKGKAVLTDEAKFVLHDLQKLMDKEENKNIKLKIVGHTSAEGSADVNQKLSENRAKAVVDFLVSQGISQNRLQYEGKGSSEPLDPNNPEVNRRTQIIVVNE